MYRTMGSLFKFLMLQLIGFNTVMPAAFNFTCPEGALRKIRSKMFCADEKQYHCMYDTLKHGYVEKCMHAQQIGEGKYSVLSGNLDVRECHQQFYSPYAESPVSSNEGHRCYYLRSLCNEEGQVAVSDGSSSTDRLCRCDFTRGYDYVTKPTDPCKCSPSTEDCSCIVRVCPRRYDKLNQDYRCEDKHKEEYECSAIVRQGHGRVPTVSSDSPKETCNDCEAKFTYEPIKRPVTVPMLLIVVVLLSILTVCVVSVFVKCVLPGHSAMIRSNTSTIADETTVLYSRTDTDQTEADIYHQRHDMHVVSYFEETKQIHAMREAFKKGGRDKIIILRGTSGSGKTQAAHYYCQEEGQKYSIVAKINAKDQHSLFNSLRDLVYNIKADTPREERDTKLTTDILCHNIKIFLTDKRHSRLPYLFLVDNARFHKDSKNLDSVLSLVKDIENLDMILTTYDSTFEENDNKAIAIEFKGMDREEYTKLLRRNENGSLVEFSEKSITDLIEKIGTLPIFVNSARKYLIATGKSVQQYLDTIKDLKPVEKLESLRHAQSKSYNEEVLDSIRLPLRDVKQSITKKLWEVMMLLPFLQYESVSTSVLEACLVHLTKGKATKKKAAIDILVIECQKFSLCQIIKTPKSRFEFPDDDPDVLEEKRTTRSLIFHELIMWALDDQEFQRNKDRRLTFLLKLFCFEIDVEARTDKTIHRNLLFLSHARKLLRENNYTEKSDELLFCLSYLHCAIGSTLLFEKADMEASHIHLVKSRCICLQIVREKSCFTKEACIFLPYKTEMVKKTTIVDIKKVANSVFQKTFARKFVRDFVLGIRRGSHDVDAIKTTAKLELSNGRYLLLNEYETLIKKKCALPIDILMKILLGELLLRILLNNGRVLNELVYSVVEKYQKMIQDVCNIEFHNANEFCKLLKQKCPSYQLFVCLENERTGRMLMRWSETAVSTSQIDNDIDCYKNMIEEPFDRCFNFGVLILSQFFNDRHICICRRILIRFLQRRYEMEIDENTKKDIFEDGLKIVQLLLEKLEQIEEKKRHYTWLKFPLFHIQCAKFLLQ